MARGFSVGGGLLASSSISMALTLRRVRHDTEPNVKGALCKSVLFCRNLTIVCLYGCDSGHDAERLRVT